MTALLNTQSWWKPNLAPLSLLLNVAVSAAPIANQDHINWFAEQGTNRNGTVISDPQRNSAASVFDASDNKWLSLGFVQNSGTGGRVYGLAEFGYSFSGTLEVRETTFNVQGANYPEAARLTFSGSLNNSPAVTLTLNQTPASCTGVLTCDTSILDHNTTAWLISGFSNYQFTSLELADVTRALRPARSEDAFDLGYIRASTSAVPEPSTAILMAGAGIVALLLSLRQYRRK